jgi:O-antigen ligase
VCCRRAGRGGGSPGIRDIEQKQNRRQLQIGCLSMQRQALHLTAFLVGVAVWPWFIGFATTPRWAVLSVMIPLMCMGLRLRWTVGHVYAVAFLGWAALSLAWTPNLADGLNELWKWLLLACAFCIGAETDDLTGFWRGVGLAVAVSAAVVAAQLADYSFVPQMAPPSGLFGNRIFLAEFAALALVGLIGRSWLAWPAIFVVAVATSLGAAAGMAVVACAWLWRRSRIAAVALPIVGLAALVVVSPRPAVESGFSRHMESAAVRAALWMDVATQITPFGHGVGSYYVAEAQASPRQMALNLRETHAHNDPLELAFEFGVPAIFLVAAVWCALGGADRRNRLVLVAFLVEGCFGFPLHNPATAFVAAVVAGHLCGAGARLRVPVTGQREDGSRRAAAPLVSPI